MCTYFVGKASLYHTGVITTSVLDVGLSLPCFLWTRTERVSFVLKYVDYSFTFYVTVLLDFFFFFLSPGRVDEATLQFSVLFSSLCSSIYK